MSRCLQVLELMVDSGAYSVFTRGRTIDLDEYATFLKSVKWSKSFVSLDVIATQSPDAAAARSWQNYLYLKSCGIQTIPVYHYGESLGWLEKMLADAPIVGISATSIARSRQDCRRWYAEIWHWVTRNNIKPKFHLFGDVSTESIRPFEWYSADGARLILQASYGLLNVFFSDPFTMIRLSHFSKAYKKGKFSAIDEFPAIVTDYFFAVDEAAKDVHSQGGFEESYDLTNFTSRLIFSLLSFSFTAQRLAELGGTRLVLPLNNSLRLKLARLVDLPYGLVSYAFIDKAFKENLNLIADQIGGCA